MQAYPKTADQSALRQILFLWEHIITLNTTTPLFITDYPDIFATHPETNYTILSFQ